jgi:N-acetylglucosamine-6-phosphate deacetylase
MHADTLRFQTVRLGVAHALVDGELVPGDVELGDGTLVAVGLAGPGSGIAAPGFVDVHIHGFAGVDFATADAEGYRVATEALLATGVTEFRPSFITASEEELVAALREVPRGLGAHLEGPFISPKRLGMHPAGARREPDAALLERFLAAGPVAHMTLAPELPGALELVDTLVARGITAACGHTDATAEQAYAAFDCGARHVTHLFNAMRPFTHRDPGIAGAALTRDDVTVELILDGHHLSDEAVRLALRAAPQRIALVTDALAAAGKGDGDWRMGPQRVFVRDGVARLENGVLAGSVLTMPAAIRELVRIGGTVAQALHAASRRSLSPGAPADVVVLDDALEVRDVFLGGVRRGL